MIRVLELISSHRRLAGMVVAAILLFAVGAAVGRRTAKPAPPQVVHDVRTQVEYRDRVVTVEKPVDRWRERTVVVYKYAPDGGVTQKIEATTKSGEHDQGSVTTVDTAGQVKVQDDLRITPPPAPRWSFYMEAGPWLDLKTGHLESLGATIGVMYTVVGPLYLGVVAVEPTVLKPVPPTVSLVAGLHGSM